MGELLLFLPISLLLHCSGVTLALEQNKLGDQIFWIPAIYFDLEELELEPFGLSNYEGKWKWFRYIARAKIDGGIILGQYSQVFGQMYGGYQGREVSVDAENAEILYTPPGTTSWIPMKGMGIRLVGNMILGGKMGSNSTSLYVCRGIVEHQDGSNMIALGYYRFETNRCTVSDNEKEIHLMEYELLIVNNYGVMAGAI